MVGAVEAAVLELQKAVLARSLYPGGHPRIQGSEERALSLLSEALEQRGEISVFAVDQRVVFDGQPLPASANLISTLFRILRERGVDQLTFRKGLGQGEIRAFLDSLSLHGREGSPPPPSGPHLAYGALRQEEGESGGEAVLPAAGAIPVPNNSPGPGALAEVWQGISDEQVLDAGMLGEIVVALSQAVTDSAGAMLPLAPLKSHDEYTFVHIINVAILSMGLAEALGFDSHATHEVGIAALLHDVGKMAVPREVLGKSGRFTEEEFRAMQVHPVAGARILLKTPGVPEIAPIVAFEHHVRFDGGGYPRVPRSWKLNLASRITQLADVFDALRTHRPYRPGMPLEKIITLMRGDAGTYFDPDLLEIFLQHVVRRGMAEGAALEASSDPAR
jgi:putative nucleotidyltransferase with HDIG domain